MAKYRCRVQLPFSRYQEIRDRIITKEEGEKRKQIQENYHVTEHGFISKILEMVRDKKAPLGICSVDPSDEPEAFKNWIATNSGFIQGLTSMVGGSGSSATILSDIQSYLMDCTHQFLWMEKCRQLGFSLTLAARALSEAMLQLKHTSIFVSYNEEESKEKVTYARELYDSLPSKYRLQRRLKYDNKTSLVFEKSGPQSAETRILSYPQRIIRGKGGNVHVRMDEAAHCIHFRKIYTSALPVLSRGDSSLWIGSTPAGKGDLFYEIAINQDNNYSTYVRIHVQWWDVALFCKDVPKARMEAPEMITDERIERFATDRLRALRRAMTLDDFQQEYECAYLDEAYSYYPWDLIMRCVPIFNVEGVETAEYSAPASDLDGNDKTRSGSSIDFYTDPDPTIAFEKFIDAVNKGVIQGPFLGGFDVGRTSDASEIVFIEESSSYHQLVRANITLKNMRLPDQRAFVSRMIETLGRKLIKFGVDYIGIGMQIAEDLEDMSYELVSKLPFNNNAWKEEAAKQMKYRMDLTAISFPTWRPLLQQIHSIKRILLPGGNWRFDAEKAQKHHGDKFWSIIAASEMGHRATTTASQSMMDFDKRLFLEEPKDHRTKNGILLPTTPVFQTESNYNPYSKIPGVQIPSLPVPNYGALKGFGKKAMQLEDMLSI
jgi:phage FluMu gp28-like protein